MTKYKKHESCVNYQYYFTYDTKAEEEAMDEDVDAILSKAHKEIKALGVEVKCTD